MTHPKCRAAGVALISVLALAPALAHAEPPAAAQGDAPPETPSPLPPPPRSAPDAEAPPEGPAGGAPSDPLQREMPSTTKPQPRGAWRSFRAGSELVRTVPVDAIFEGAWSIALNITTTLTNRTWDAPWPRGTIGQYSTRLLYGMSWTLMMGLESLAVVAASHGKLDWLAEAAFRTDWVVPVDLPACPRVGAWAGCGLGIGSFSLLQIRPLRSKWWYEAGGGWFQQRVLNDALRTVAESSWVLTPISAIREIKTDPQDAVAFRFFVGPGIYFGMHNAHMHPTVRGADIYPDVPWTQMYPLDAGIGPGARVEGRMIVEQHLSLEAEVVIAPFLVGGPSKHVASDVAPLDFTREGMSVWRKVGLGLAWDDPVHLPFKATVALFGAELSERPVERIGYRGAMLRFDIPLKLPRED